ncbi:MAG: type IIL restriction-modification enzyme MmeI, partial [Thermoleophilia bacterium]
VGDGPDGAVRLPANRGHAFQGPIPVGAGFVLDEDEARRLLSLSDANYAEVVRPYLVGDDIATDPGQSPRRWIIDFAVMPLEDAMRYPAALQILRERVKPVRDTNRRKVRREKWWRFAEPAVGMRAAIAPLRRYIAANAQGKRILFVWCGPVVCPSNLTNIFAFDDDYSMGVLTSRLHGEWARLQSSTLRVDIRYTPTSAFETFPWPPAPTSAQRDAVATLAAELIGLRQEICATQHIGLTTLYNHVDEGAWADVGDLHRQLDEAVAAAYGWPVSVAAGADEAMRRLLGLNAAIAAGEIDYDPFAAG